MDRTPHQTTAALTTQHRVNPPDLDYRGLFDASPNPYLVLDRSLRIVGANKAYLAATKRELADIVGRWAWDAFPSDPETVSRSVASFERVIRTGQPDTMALLRFDIPRPEEEGGGFEPRYWSIVHTPVLNRDGEVELVLQHPIDVTELQGLREAASLPEDASAARLGTALTGIVDRARSVYEDNLTLKADSERLRELFERSPSPIAVLAGKEHVFELANEAFHELVGRRGLLGKPLLEALPELAGQGIDTLLDKIFDTGKPFVGRGLKLSLQQRPGASLTDVYHDVLYQPLFGPDGRVRALFCQGNEVTETYRAHAALRESQERLALALRAGGSAAWEIDVATERLLPADDLLFTMVGFAPGELTTVAEWLSRIHGEDRPGVVGMIDDVIHGRRDSYWIELRLQAKDESWRWLLCQAVAAERDSGGLARRLVGTHTDITARKVAEAEIQRLNAELEMRVQERTAQLQQSNEALIQSNMELQRFAHAAAHDLQTPLRSIAGFAQLLQRELKGRLDERADGWLTQVIDNTRRLQTLILELLAYARLDVQARPLEPVDLGEVFDQVLATLAAPIGETGAQVSREALPTLLADRTQMAQLLQNLIENGIKYNHSNPPRVSVTWTARDGEAVFAVADNGIGIAPRHHQRIFEIFRRLHSHGQIPGTGIGLAICQRIVERHGGRLWVESEPGRGSTFYFALSFGSREAEDGLE